MNSFHVHLYSNNKWLVGQQKKLFDMLWDRAIPASIKIKQIQLGLQEVFELIRDEHRIILRYQKALKSLDNELYIFYSTSEQEVSINRAQSIFAAIIDELLKNGSKQRIKISILILTESHLKPFMSKDRIRKITLIL